MNALKPRSAVAACVLAALAANGVVHAADDLLDPERAFVADLRPAAPGHLAFSVVAAPGYYLYRDQFHFEAEGATLGTPEIPHGISKYDETFQKELEIHHGRVDIDLPVASALKEGGTYRLRATYQGCAEQGVCYPPQLLRANVGVDAAEAVTAVQVLPGRDAFAAPARSASAPSESIPSAGASVPPAAQERETPALRWTWPAVACAAAVLIAAALFRRLRRASPKGHA